MPRGGTAAEAAQLRENEPHPVRVLAPGMQIVQHLVDRRWPRKPIAPNVSQSFNWTGWLIAVAVASLVGGVMAGLTPFKPAQAVAMALIACVAGSLGHLVMKALKRDRGITNWGSEGKSVTGATGLLDRVVAGSKNPLETGA